MENKELFKNEHMETNKNTKNKAKFYTFGSISLLILLFFSALYEIKFRYKSTNTGLQYKILKKTGQKKIEENSFFRVEREISYNGKILEYKNQYGYSPLILSKENIFFKDFDGKYFEAVNLLDLGDEYIFKIKAEDIPISYGMQQLNTKEETFVNVKITIVEVFPKEKTREVVLDFFEKRKQDADNLFKEQEKSIEKYLESKKQKFEKKNKYYLVVENDKKDLIKAGDKIKLNFIIRDDKGKLEATNIKGIAKKEKLHNETFNYEPVQISVVDSKEWLMDCLKFFKKGSKGFVYLTTANVMNLDFSKKFFEVELEVVDVEVKKEDVKEKEVKKKEEKEVKKKEEKEVKKKEEKENKKN